MRIVVGMDEVRETGSRLKAVAVALYRQLDRPVWPTPYGLWAKGVNNEGLVEWDRETQTLLAAFLAGEAEAVELEVPDGLIAPGTSLTETRDRV